MVCILRYPVDMPQPSRKTDRVSRTKTVRMRDLAKAMTAGELVVEYEHDPSLEVRPGWRRKISVDAAGDISELVGPPGPAFAGVRGSKGFLVALDFDATTSPADDVRLLAVVDGLGIEMPLAPGAGSEIRIVRLDGERPTAVDFSRLGLGAVHRALTKLLQHEWSVQHLGDAYGAVRVPWPGRAGRDPLVYALAAQDYVEALAVEPRTPIRRMQELAPPGTTADELRARLRRARNHEPKLLTAAGDGKAGGELTDHAKQMLRDAGLLREGNE